MDISELSQITTSEAQRRRFLKDLTDAFARFSKPIIAAVTGYAVRFPLFFLALLQLPTCRDYYLTTYLHNLHDDTVTNLGR